MVFLTQLILLSGLAWLVLLLIQGEPRMIQKQITPKKTIKKQKSISELTTEEVWQRFVKIKKLHKQNIGKTHEKELERRLVETQSALQDPKLGFFMGDAVELGIEKADAKRFPLYLPWSNLYNHFIFYGTTRFGKTRALANHARQFINQGYNVIVIDPKGGENQEILSWVLEFASEANRLDDMMYFNPVYPTITDYFNPLFGKRNDEIASDLQLYATNGGQAKADFFVLRISQVVKAICAGCEYMEKIQDPTGNITKSRIEDEVRTFVSTKISNGHKILSLDKNTLTATPDVAERSINRISQSPKVFEQLVYNRTLMTFKDLAHFAYYTNLESLLYNVQSTPIQPSSNKEYIKEMEILRDEAILQIQGAMGQSKDQYEKTTASLIELLNKLSTGSVGRMFCSSPINPIALRIQSRDKGVIAVVQPSPLKFQTVSEMIMKIFLKTLESTFGNAAASGRVFEKRTVMLIDEASKAMFPGIEELLNKLAGIGLTMGLYTQSQADITMMLEKATATVIKDNINTVAYMKTNDLESRVNASDDFGERKMLDYQMQMQGGMGGMGRAGITSEMQAIAHRDTFDELKIGEALIKSYGKRYFVQLPFQQAPHSSFEMPILDLETLSREMNDLQTAIENSAHSTLEPEDAA